MKIYTITLTEKERADILYCIARSESITEMNYNHATCPKEKQRRKATSERYVALWHKIKETEPNEPRTTSNNN